MSAKAKAVKPDAAMAPAPEDSKDVDSDKETSSEEEEVHGMMAFLKTRFSGSADAKSKANPAKGRTSQPDAPKQTVARPKSTATRNKSGQSVSRDLTKTVVGNAGGGDSSEV